MLESPVHVDVLIVGAGLSGIGAAAQLTREHPQRSYLVLESRTVSGGTWDLFRYPGVRSDSDMFTLGYRFKPWRGDQALVDGPSILAYVRETAREYGVDDHIRYGHSVVRASWDSPSARWTVTARTGEGDVTITTSLLWSCCGYYDYDQGYTPELPGLDRYTGRVVHPQHWPEDLDVTGQRVLVVGSGATAVTLVPALAGVGAAHVTMLQRSPTYVLSLPAKDPVAGFLDRWLPERAAYAAVRWKNVLVATGSYQLSRRRPEVLRRFIRKQAIAQLPEGYDVDTHFRPTYDPWDQRLCLAPNGDFFRALSNGSASVSTDIIATFTETGVRLASGAEIEADLVVTATGLQMTPFGHIELAVDHEPVKVPETMAYQALMLSGVPNFVFTMGYTNASWTLKADLVAEYACRLLRHLDQHGFRTVVPVPDPAVERRPLMLLSSGYIKRSEHLLPSEGDRAPWRMAQNYYVDQRIIRRAPIDDGVMRFT